MPDYNMNVGQSRTFSPYLSDKGRGRYFQYNATAPMPVQCVFGWDGDTFSRFREAWETSADLAFGSNWMRITLPVDLARGDRGTRQYDTYFTTPFTSSLAGYDWWKITMSLDLDASPLLVTA